MIEPINNKLRAYLKRHGDADVQIWANANHCITLYLVHCNHLNMADVELRAEQYDGHGMRHSRMFPLTRHCSEPHFVDIARTLVLALSHDEDLSEEARAATQDFVTHTLLKKNSGAKPKPPKKTYHERLVDFLGGVHAPSHMLHADGDIRLCLDVVYIPETGADAIAICGNFTRSGASIGFNELIADKFVDDVSWQKLESNCVDVLSRVLVCNKPKEEARRIVKSCLRRLNQAMKEAEK